MTQCNPPKLAVKYVRPANDEKPVHGRKYTLIHSNGTGDLLLTINYSYDLETIDEKMRDEVLAEWMIAPDHVPALFGVVLVSNGQFSEEIAMQRFTIFEQEMTTSLQGIIQGDEKFFRTYPALQNAPIYIYFQSIYPAYAGLYYYGTPKQYLS
ncbi:staygreen family protein [Ectobacillus polymachus]|uniref:staygreen family protein n=1 Tax=Ectobacillus polymachus TaxID=1508806 RepID=UPI003A8B5CFE